MSSASIFPRFLGSLPLLGVALALGACNVGVKSAVGPKGTHILTCGNGMKGCIVKADKICGDDGYQIIEGLNVPKVLGGSSSSYRSRVEKAELTIRCGMPEGDEQPQHDIVFRLPKRKDAPIEPEEPVEALPAQQPAPAPDKQVCTPGATQACVGPGACDGGQMCLESGAGYGPCDCGRSAPAPSTSDPSTSAPGDEPQVDVPGAAPAPTPLSK